MLFQWDMGFNTTLTNRRMRIADPCAWHTRGSLPQDVTRAVTIEMLDVAGEVVGYIDLVETVQPNVWETHSHLDEEYRNCGLGVLLYDRAISLALKRGWSVVSSSVTSIDAMRVWHSKRLNSKYVISVDGDKFTVLGLREKTCQQRLKLQNQCDQRAKLSRQSTAGV